MRQARRLAGGQSICCPPAAIGSLGGGAPRLRGVFSLTTSGKERILHSFAGSPDGVAPQARLRYLNGRFYGTTCGGGNANVGTIFSATTAGDERIHHSFSGGDIVCPTGGVTAVKRALYGITFSGGSYNWGTVYVLNRKMKRLELSRYALAIGAASVLLAGCGALPLSSSNGQEETQPPGAMPQSRAIARQTYRGGSWMLPEAKRENLLYVGGYNVQTTNSGFVDVFDYDTRKLVGTLTGFAIPSHQCVDRHGNLYITDFGAGSTLEYAHGGTKPLHVLKSPTYPVGCSIDPATGHIAIANTYSQEYSYSSLSVYRRVKGSPADYKTLYVEGMEDCAFDDRGDILTTGWRGYYEYKSAFAMLRAHRKALRKFKAKTVNVDVPNGLQWDGSYFAITGSNEIVQFTVSDGGGTIEGRISLANSGSIGASWIVSSLNSVVVTNNSRSSGVTVNYYSYPSGGAPTAKIAFPSYLSLGGISVSLAPSR